MGVTRALRTTSTLRLRLLGGARIESGGAAVTVDTRKAVALLAYLAVTGDAHARDRLAALFWPDADPERSRGALRRTLSALRTSAAGPWLQADGQRVAVQHERLDLDVAEFRRAIAASKLAEAAELYRGEFLAGFSLRDSPDFDEWQTTQAEMLRREAGLVLAHLTRERAAEDDIPAAIAYARRWLSLDSLHEPAHRELMRLYASSGDRSAALRQYAECEHRLDRELGLRPMPETAQLAASIRDGSFDPAGAVAPRAALPGRATADVQEALADVHTLHGDYAKAIAGYGAAAAAATGERRRRIEHKLANVHHRRGDWRQAEEHYRAALQGENDLGRRARLQADWSLAAHRRGDALRAARVATEALAIARSADDRRALAQVRNILGILARDNGDHGAARAHLEQSLALALELGDDGARVAALNNLALACADAGDLPQAIALTEQALTLCRDQGDRHREAALHNNLADLMRRVGRREEAMRHLKRAVTLFAGIDESAREPEVWKLVAW